MICSSIQGLTLCPFTLSSASALLTKVVVPSRGLSLMLNGTWLDFPRRSLIWSLSSFTVCVSSLMAFSCHLDLLWSFNQLLDARVFCLTSRSSLDVELEHLEWVEVEHDLLVKFDGQAWVKHASFDAITSVFDLITPLMTHAHATILWEANDFLEIKVSLGRYLASAFLVKEVWSWSSTISSSSFSGTLFLCIIGLHSWLWTSIPCTSLILSIFRSFRYLWECGMSMKASIKGILSSISFNYLSKRALIFLLIPSWIFQGKALSVCRVAEQILYSLLQQQLFFLQKLALLDRVEGRVKLKADQV